MGSKVASRGSAASGMRWIRIGKVEEWDRNPRHNEAAIPSVARSLLRFGFVAPAVVWKSRGELRAGHTRLKAVRFLQAHRPTYDEAGAFTGWEDRPEGDPFHVVAERSADGATLAPFADAVPVRWVEFESEAEADAYALADNKLGELAEWDNSGLVRVLEELKTDVSIDDLGWGAAELERLSAGLIAVQGHTRDPSNQTPDPPMPANVEPTSVVGGRYEVGRQVLHCGDCLDVLRGLPDASVDAIVTDPPYGLSAPPDVAEVLRAWLAGEQYDHGRPGFMGADWDSFVPGPAVWREALRVAKPGAHAVVFAGTRTQDLMAIALRLAGWEVRDCGAWCYWQGFPKSLDISKAIDALHGAEREVVGHRTDGAGNGSVVGLGTGRSMGTAFDLTAPATPDAQRWSGWGSGLKPAHEPWLLCRKPLEESSIARQVLATGTGGLNLDACRFAPGDVMWPGPEGGLPDNSHRIREDSALCGAANPTINPPSPLGRFPANLIHTPKPSRAERERGCEAIEQQHPTVKPLRLMQWLVRLVTPPGGLVVDPFCGSGTTLMASESQGFRGIGVELLPAHADIALARIGSVVDTE